MDWDEMLKFDKTTKEQMEEGAKMIFDFYSSLINAGFTDGQALEITISILCSMLETLDWNKEE